MLVGLYLFENYEKYLEPHKFVPKYIRTLNINESVYLPRSSEYFLYSRAIKMSYNESHAFIAPKMFCRY